jgi:F-type H+-transporting ATPase subunit epsilon
MNLELITPEKKIFSGEATAVNMPAIDGMVEVLDRHAPMIAALKQGQIKISSKTGNKIIEISGGFAEVLNNNVVILAETATEQA